MNDLLLRNISHLVTMDKDESEFLGGEIYIKDGVIEYIGKRREKPLGDEDKIYNLDGYVVLPGLINTHHHFYQTLTRVISQAQDANLFNWLKILYPIWARITPDDIFISTAIALAELALSGCTTTSDHLYLYPNGSKLDDEIAAAKISGMRLHASRGSMSLGVSKGGLPPDDLVEKEDLILQDSLRLIETFHDPHPGSNLQIVLAPCSPFSVSPLLMRKSAELARQYQVHLHTHLAETKDEEQYCLEKFNKRPVEYMEELGWIGEDVWFAHAVHLDSSEIETFARTGCGVAHCPSSNMRLSSGIAPIMKLIFSGVNIGLGVDGSASNDSSNMLLEVRQSMLLSRLNQSLEDQSPYQAHNLSLMTARQALKLATVGGARVLGRNDIGSLEPGKFADLIAIKMDKLPFAGALEDPVAALVFCAPFSVDYSFVGGKLIVDHGNLVNFDLPHIIDRHNRQSKKLIRGV